MNKVNIFFVQKWQPYTVPWPSGHVICFSYFFSREDVVSPRSFVFCCMITYFIDPEGNLCSWAFLILITDLLNKSSPHSAKKKTKCVNASEGGGECRMLTMKYWEHHYVVAIIDVLFCFCCARLVDFQKEWLTIRGIALQPNTWQPDQKWLCLFWVMSGSFASAQTKLQ